MEIISYLVDFVLHLDHHLKGIIEQYGALTYFIVFAIIFCETGLVVTPFLPGDSLLFALGAFAAVGALNLYMVLIILIVAAILGDTLNYWIGHMLAPKIIRNEKIRFIKQEYIDRTHKFFEKYGGKTIIIARFVPIIRTFAPFMAGVGTMTYGRFLFYNVIGGILWVTVCVFAGYFFGNLPFVQDNFSLVVLGIIVVSMIPAVIEFMQHHRTTNQKSN
jgi:membrane-associated protein